MTDDDRARLEEIRARAEAATPGPWGYCGDPDKRNEQAAAELKLQLRKHEHGACPCGSVWSEPRDFLVCTVTVGKWGDTYPSIKFKEGSRPGGISADIEPTIEMCDYGEVLPEAWVPNMRFIAAAREDIPYLLGAVAARDARIAELEREAAEWRERAGVTRYDDE